MSKYQMTQPETFGWLVFKWWVMPALSVLAGLFLGAALRYGTLSAIYADGAASHPDTTMISQAWDCSD